MCATQFGSGSEGSTELGHLLLRAMEYAEVNMCGACLFVDVMAYAAFTRLVVEDGASQDLLMHKLIVAGVDRDLVVNSKPLELWTTTWNHFSNNIQKNI